jgi:hypothetical protein
MLSPRVVPPFGGVMFPHRHARSPVLRAVTDGRVAGRRLTDRIPCPGEVKRIGCMTISGPLCSSCTAKYMYPRCTRWKMKNEELHDFRMKFARLAFLLNVLLLLVAGIPLAFFLIPTDLKWWVIGFCIVLAIPLSLYFSKKYHETKSLIKED